MLKIGERYYVWYTRRQTQARKRQVPPAKQTWDVPAFDWDLAEIWYATSADGFHWEERGVAARRGPRDAHDGRSIFTPDVLYAEGRYWLYYQAVGHPYGIRTRNTVCMSWSDSPDGPWQRWPEALLRPGEPGEWLGEADDNEVLRYGAWDSHKVHDPFVFRREGRYWLYYKGQPMGWGTRHDRGIGLGVAIADRPQGPFVKSPLNPVTNSGHETCLFPWGDGVAAICGHDGPEKDSVQFAPDGLNFELMSCALLPPPAPGPFVPDAFNDTRDGRGITWGLAHIATEETKGENSWIIRFDCDLRRGMHGGPASARRTRRCPPASGCRPTWSVNEANNRQRRWHPQTPDPPPHPPVEQTQRRHPTRLCALRRRQGPDERIFFGLSLRSGPWPGAAAGRFPPRPLEGHPRQRPTPWCGIRAAAVTTNEERIWHASSADGIRWQEQGPVQLTGPGSGAGDTRASAPDIIVQGGAFWLFYQTGSEPATSGAPGAIGVARAETPDGPWRHMAAPALQPGAPDAWDAGRLHDPTVLFWRDQVWLFYRGERGGAAGSGGWGVARADDPRGPYRRSALNPVSNSGRAPFLYPWRDGLVAITGQAGPEANCVQFAADGLNYEIVGRVSAPPVSAGPLLHEAWSDAATSAAGGTGVARGLCHCSQGEDGPLQFSHLLRFECNLRMGEDRQDFYRSWNYRFPPSAYFSRDLRLGDAGREEALALMRAIDEETTGPD